MTTHAVTVSKVMHPTTGEVLAIEIVANDGQVYFAAKPGGRFEGVCCNDYPRIWNGDESVRPERVEIARIEP